MHRVIGERSLAETTVSPEQARAFLREMVRARVFDERAVALQRRGWMSGYPPFRGQEASQVGAVAALAADDWLFPTYRTNAMQLARGRPPTDVLRFRRGHSEYERGRTGPAFTQSTPIATHLPHAVGAAMASRYDGVSDGANDGDAGDGSEESETVVCAYFGDGATSEGDFHEALNFAGVFSAPALFFCENNHWAISMPEEGQTRSETIAGKARAYGFEGVRVDGNDPVAVFEVVSEARESVVVGDPVLVESLTYRQGAHSTSDDPDRYRGDVDLPDWRTADPIERFGGYLVDEGVIESAEGFVADVRDESEAWVDEAVDAVESESEPGPGDVFDHAYAEMPPRVAAQREDVLARAAESGSESPE